MTDRDHPKNFAPDRFELPASTQLYMHAQQALNRYTDEATTALMQTLDGAGREALEEYLAQGVQLPLSFHEKRLPISIEGSDELSITSLYPPEEAEGNYLPIVVNLYRDGALYLPDRLVEQGIDYEQFWIIASPNPEESPFVFAFMERELEDETHGTELSIGDYKTLRYRRGDPLRELTEEQAQQLITELPQLTVDIVEIRAQLPYLQ